MTLCAPTRGCMTVLVDPAAQKTCKSRGKSNPIGLLTRLRSSLLYSYLTERGHCSIAQCPGLWSKWWVLPRSPFLLYLGFYPWKIAADILRWNMSCWWQREWRTKLVWHCIQWAWKSFSTVGEGWQPWCSIPNQVSNLHSWLSIKGVILVCKKCTPY